MLKLIRKDLRVIAAFGWLIVWLVAPSYLVPATLAAHAGGAILWVHIAFGAAAVASVCLLDARTGADRFIHSLPLARTDVVRGRYGTAVVFAFIVMGIGAAFGLAVGAASSEAAWPRWLAADVGLAYLFVMAIIIAVYLPCYFRWGFGAGAVVAAVLLAALVIGIDLAGSAPGSGIESGLPQPGLPRGLVMRLTAAAAERWGIVATSFAGVAGAAALLWLSSCVAGVAYRRREF